MPSHIPRTLKLLKADGWTVDIVERWVGQPGRKCDQCGHFNLMRGKRKDLFGVGDLLAFKGGLEEALGFRGFGIFRIVQVCAYSGVSAHINKIEDNPEARRWLRCGGEIEVIGWHKKKKKPHHKRELWTPRRVMVR